MSINLTLGKVRFSYLKVFVPEAMEEGQEKKYSVSVLVPKKDKQLVKKIQTAFDEVKKDPESVRIWGGKVPKDLKISLRDGDEDRDDEAYKDHLFFNASCKKRPGVVGADKEPILQDDFKSGDYGYINVTIYAFNNVSRGIAVMLNHIMKTQDGEALGGGVSLEEAFVDIEVEDLLG